MTHAPLSQPVRDVVDASNAGEVETCVAVCSENGVIDDWGTKLLGRAGQRSWPDTDALDAVADEQVSLFRTLPNA